jgi:hypothetical protein
VLRNIEGLSRFAHENIPGFTGPHIGKQRKQNEGKRFLHTPSSSTTKVLLSQGGARGYQAAISGGGR